MAHEIRGITLAFSKYFREINAHAYSMVMQATSYFVFLSFTNSHLITSFRKVSKIVDTDLSPSLARICWVDFTLCLLDKETPKRYVPLYTKNLLLRKIFISSHLLLYIMSLFQRDYVVYIEVCPISIQPNVLSIETNTYSVGAQTTPGPYRILNLLHWNDVPRTWRIFGPNFQYFFSFKLITNSFIHGKWQV
ncbi:hypothetical protein WN51_06440 [Melipona quadrifasciata]|uniref:Uncharacterized protein n=1 Tax=Melipona quadrifasciata TaxID=166423 RepID=A0A0N0U794_9HYME|nr:hypothetical protein WN51_06440 [Melipona quadrifasciata]